MITEQLRLNKLYPGAWICLHVLISEFPLTQGIVFHNHPYDRYRVVLFRRVHYEKSMHPQVPCGILFLSSRHLTYHHGFTTPSQQTLQYFLHLHISSLCLQAVQCCDQHHALVEEIVCCAVHTGECCSR